MMRIADEARQLSLKDIAEAIEEEINPESISVEVGVELEEMTAKERSNLDTIETAVKEAIEDRIAGLTSALIHRATFPTY